MPEVAVVQHRPLNPKGLVIITETGTATALPVSPSKWEYQDMHRWGQIEREGHKAVSRRRGSGLRTLDFSILVAALDYRVSVESRIRDITGWAARGNIIRIKNGSPTYQGANWWYIKGMSMSVNRVTLTGEPTQVTLNFSLEEYVDATNSVIKPPPPPPPRPAPTQTATPQPSPTREPVYRYHTVVAGDWLSKLALIYLGDMSRWPEIYALNRTLIGPNPALLRAGLRLRIPPR